MAELPTMPKIPRPGEEEPEEVLQEVPQEVEEVDPAIKRGTDFLAGVQEGIINTQNLGRDLIRQTLKDIHWESRGLTGAGNKFANWVMGLGIHAEDIHLTGEGIGGLLQTELVPPGTKILDLRLDKDRGEFAGWLRSSWRDIPDFKEDVRIRLGQIDPHPEATERAQARAGVDEDTIRILDQEAEGMDLGVGGETTATPEIISEEVEIDQDLVLGLSQEFEDDYELLFAADEQGDMFIDRDEILQRAYDEVAAEWTTRMASEANWVVISERPTGPGFPQYAPGTRGIGFILSFDGTAYGDVETVTDLFSGGWFGPARAGDWLRGLLRDDPDKFLQFQQQLYALGLYEGTDANGMARRLPRWGYIESVGTDPTIQALHDLQSTWLGMQIENPNVTPNELRNMLVVKRGEEAGTRATTSRDLQNAAAVTSFNQALEIVQSLGHNITAKGKDALTTQINELIRTASPIDQERMFGQGGTQGETALADAVLTEFFGTSQWENELSFGSRDTQTAFLDYAQGVGAVSQEEYNLLESGSLVPTAPQITGKNISPVRRDVAMAHFLKLLNAEAAEREDVFGNVTGIEEAASPDQIERALVSFAHTVGMRHQRVNNVTDYGGIVQRAQQRLAVLPATNPFTRQLGEQAVAALDIERTAPEGVMAAISRGMGGGVAVPRSQMPNV